MAGQSYNNSSTSGLIETWFQCTFRDMSTTLELPPSRSVHGICTFPLAKYALVEVPPHVPLRALEIQHLTPVRGYTRRVLLSSSYNLPKALFALLQAVWGVLTLYRARGNQIDMYGYAAFGLSVTPYVMMSMMNIIANIVSPEYPTMYLVHTPDMDLAEEDGGRFHGVIATVALDNISSPLRLRRHPKSRRFGRYIKIFSYLLVSCIPIAVVLGLSKAKLGTASDQSQAAWMLSWLLVGSLTGGWVKVCVSVFRRILTTRLGYSVYFAVTVIMLVSVAPLWIASIGGMVVVGRQLYEFGTCVRLSH
jgi:hypothetical protein